MTTVAVSLRSTIVALAFVAALAAGAAGRAAAQSPLADAIMDGDLDRARSMLTTGSDPNAAQGDGTTPLHWAVYQLDTQLVDQLIARGARADVTNAYGASPLTEAVRVAHAGLVTTLIAAGADIEARNRDGQTALMLAARSGSAAIAETLLDAGADANARETWRGQTALMWAADARFPDLVRLLIDHGADVEARAMANDWGVQVTSEPRAQYRPTGGLTPLLYAARAGCAGCVEALLDAGADPDLPNPDGVTPLLIALDNFGFDAAAVLLDRGANPHVWDWWGRTPLYVAVDMNSFARRRGRGVDNEATAIDLVTRLLGAGVNPDPQLNMHRPGRGANSSRFVDDLLTTGATPLLRAAIGHDVAAIELLLAAGAMVDLPNVMGVTPLMAAAGVGVSQRDRRLDYGGDVERRSIAALELLLDAGADIDARIVAQYHRTSRIARPSTMTEREGQTALYGAVKWGWQQVAGWLLDNGASVDVVDVRGMSPLDAALGRTGGRDNTVSEGMAMLLGGSPAAADANTR